MSHVHFNYIVTVHNKENLIKEVLEGILNTMSKKSTVYPVLDGCNDSTESIIDEIIQLYPQYRIKKLFADDVHELKSINVGLNGSDQRGVGYNVILQDDVVLQEEDLENKIIKLYESFENLGIVSFRHGGNLSRKLFSKELDILPISNYVENVKGHNPTPLNKLEIGSFTYREIAIKSPICIPTSVIRKVGLPDERFAPWDDISYCYIVNSYGFNNGVFAINYKSEIEWGTTRRKEQEVKLHDVQKKNLKLFKQLYGKKLMEEQIRAIYKKNKFIVFKPKVSSSLGVIKSLKGYSRDIKKFAKNTFKYYLN